MEFHLFYLLFNLPDLLLFLLNLLLVLQLTSVVVLDYLQLLQPLRKHLVLVEKRIHLPPNRLVVLLQLLQLSHHLLVHVLLYSGQQALLCSIQIAGRTLPCLLMEGMQQSRVISAFSRDEKGILRIILCRYAFDLFRQVMKTQEGMSCEG